MKKNRGLHLTAKGEARHGGGEGELVKIRLPLRGIKGKNIRRSIQ